MYNKKSSHNPTHTQFSDPTHTGTQASVRAGNAGAARVTVRTDNPQAGRHSISTVRMTKIALMTAILCVLSPIAISIPLTPVPISLATLVILFMAYVLTPRDALASVALYLLIGAIGIPVYAGFSAGADKVAGPTGGYMIGYLFMAVITAKFVSVFPGRRILQIVGMLLGTAVCYAFGTIWLAAQLRLGFMAALGVGVLPYLPGDAMKIAAAALAGPQIKNTLTRSGIQDA